MNLRLPPKQRSIIIGSSTKSMSHKQARGASATPHHLKIALSHQNALELVAIYQTQMKNSHEEDDHRKMRVGTK